MDYSIRSFRHALAILQEQEFVEQFQELLSIIESIDDESLIIQHRIYRDSKTRTPKSLSVAINQLLKVKFVEYGWNEESYIFQDTEYRGEKWRLDFAKDDISIEVAFNHSSAIAWNLLKPVLASELNHVEKAIQTQIGVIITATNSLKISGGFDSAIGTFEKYVEYLKPLNSVLSVPILVIGLEAPKTFKMIHNNSIPRQKFGEIKFIDEQL